MAELFGRKSIREHSRAILGRNALSRIANSKGNLPSLVTLNFLSGYDIGLEYTPARLEDGRLVPAETK